MNTVLIADDELNIQKIMKAFLEKNGYHVIAFTTGVDLFHYFLSLQNTPLHLQDICCIVLDIMMPEKDGFEICKLLREHTRIPIIMVSARSSDFDKVKGLRLGSDDYLAKPFSPIELVARVDALKRRFQYTSEPSTLPIPFQKKIQKIGSLQLMIESREALSNNQSFDLSPTEFTLLLYLSENQHRAVSREELLANVWNIQSSMKTRVIDDTLKRLRKKLKTVHSEIEIETIWGYGYLLRNGGSL